MRAYDLLIEVQPARWLFLDLGARAYRFGEPLLAEDAELGPSPRPLPMMSEGYEMPLSRQWYRMRPASCCWPP